MDAIGTGAFDDCSVPSAMSIPDKQFFHNYELPSTKFRAAIQRLENPHELEENYRRKYVAYLQNNAHKIFHLLFKSQDIAAIASLAKYDAIPEETAERYLDKAAKDGLTEVTAILLDYKHRRWSHKAGPGSTLDKDPALNEWNTEVNGDGTLTITRYTGSSEHVKIPSEIYGTRVKALEGILGWLRVSIFFPYMENVRSVEIGEGIEVIGRRAFLECSNLKSVAIPGSVQEIGREAFYGCSSLDRSCLPDRIKEIAPDAF